MARFRIWVIETAGSYIGSKRLVETVEADGVELIATGVTLYLDGELIRVVPGHLYIEKLVDETLDKNEVGL